MSESDSSVVVPMGAGDGPAERLPPDPGFDGAEERRGGEFSGGLVSIGFITAALRRTRKFWCAIAAVGFLLGLGLYLRLPPTYQATTSVLLLPPPGQNASDSILTDSALAQSHTVAGLALHKLGLRQTVSSFLGTYTVIAVTDRVLLFTVTAPSSSDAVTWASALATEFLQFRATQVEKDQQLLLSSLDQQVSQSRLHLRSITGQISRVSALPPSPALRAKLNSLRAQRSQAVTALAALEQTTNSTRASTEAATASIVRGSGVLDAATPALPSRHSRLKHLVVFAGGGLIVGLALGLGIVIVRELVSERLRRRDDVALALGAPVKLSIGKVRLNGWPLGPRGLAAAESPGVRRIIGHLGAAVAADSTGRAALAVVPVGDPQVAAISLVSLAASCARQLGLGVALADICRGAPAARLLGVSEAGVHKVNVNDADLVLAVPNPDDVAPIGPLLPVTASAPLALAGEEGADAFAAADLLLTLANLDPAVGCEHLATWSPVAVVIVTAGQSSWTKINAVGEMIRLAGARLVSAVLVGADKTDESLGVTYQPESGSGRTGMDDGFGLIVTSPGGADGG